MKMTLVDSSNLTAIGYDIAKEILFVRMKSNNKLYSYHSVPLKLYTDFVLAESKGRFFVKNIKDKFETEKLED